MAADDPIIVSRENKQEADSILALQLALRPWRLTPVDVRDDIGRDGFFQIHDPLHDAGNRSRATPFTFFVQVRSHAAPFLERHAESLDTRHLKLWSSNAAHCTIVFVWSEADNVFRWRAARDLRAEADVVRSGWESRDSVDLDFLPSDPGTVKLIHSGRVKLIHPFVQWSPEA